MKTERAEYIESFYQGMTEPDLFYERNEDAGPREINLSKIDNIVFDGVDMKDFPEFTDAFIASADMNGHPMTPEELDDLNENYVEWVHDKLFNQLY